jgi:transmembrane anterior posterior transformation protein 1
VFHRNNAYDLMRGLIVVLSCLLLRSLQISRVYHYIRGQATIKLYVLTAMFEILDKLMISFGQDTLDSLYWSTKLNTSKR